MAKRRGATSTISSQCQQWNHQQVPSYSFEVPFRRIQSAYSKVTSIICMQETTSCSKAPNAKVGNLNNFTMISISTHLLQNWCGKSSADGYTIPCINYNWDYDSRKISMHFFCFVVLYFLQFIFVLFYSWMNNNINYNNNGNEKLNELRCNI